MDGNWLAVFDFDGVLVDPLEEVVMAATKTFNELNGTDHAPEFFFEKFANSTQLIRTGKDVMPIIGMIAQGEDTTKMGRWQINKLKQKMGETEVLGLETEYYKRKQELREDRDAWLNTLKPHQAAIEAFGKAMEHLDTWIVSTRDAESILLFLESQGIWLEPEKIIDKTVSHEKDRQFELLAQKTRVPFAKMIFFEDTLYNAIDVKRLGVKVYLSTWGFSKEMQWKIAETKRIQLIKQEDILPVIAGHAGVQF
ncbi:MAG: HAD hydrolase-like protein [Candidatus Diapherotrites archaeon]|nr:HAD hydrolase-like protein [Candidatus Diapherotrites archaeon]